MSAEEIRRLFAAYVERQIAATGTTTAQAAAFASSLDALDDILAGRMGQLSAAELIGASHE